jgi:phenylacetate-CoA ligase
MALELRQILNRYPRWKQLARKMAARIPLSLRLGKNFWGWYIFLEESQQWTVKELSEFQLERIRLLLTELIQTSKFYRERLNLEDVKNISSLDEFRNKISIISRDEFQENYAKILSTTWQKQHPIHTHTSGTTGMALQLYHSANDESREWASICHQWKRVGYDPGNSRRAEFRGLTTPNNFIDFYPELNMIRCSILHLKPYYIRSYADVIRKYQIKFYNGYPSAFYLLAKELCDHEIDFPQPEAIMFSSEMVYDWQLDQIRRVFPATKLFAHYGCTERTVLAGWCEYRKEYHVLPQYALVEVEPKNSSIVGTNLYNTINGFIRYLMTDTALEEKLEPCSDCSRPYLPRLLKLEGRLEDYLYSPEKGWIPPVVIDFFLRGTLNIIRETQFWQRERNQIIVRYTEGSGSNLQGLQEQLRILEEGMHRIFGRKIAIVFERLGDFERSPSGKFKWIVNELDGPFSH